MAGNPRTVTADTQITWDGVSQRLPRGQVLDVTPGSALERAIGRDRLVPLGAVTAQPPAEQPAPQGGGGGGEHAGAPQAPQAAPPRPRAAAAKKQDDATDGDA